MDGPIGSARKTDRRTHLVHQCEVGLLVVDRVKRDWNTYQVLIAACAPIREIYLPLCPDDCFIKSEKKVTF